MSSRAEQLLRTVRERSLSLTLFVVTPRADTGLSSSLSHPTPIHHNKAHLTENRVLDVQLQPPDCTIPIRGCTNHSTENLCHLYPQCQALFPLRRPFFFSSWLKCQLVVSSGVSNYYFHLKINSHSSPHPFDQDYWQGDHTSQLTQNGPVLHQLFQHSVNNSIFFIITHKKTKFRK